MDEMVGQLPAKAGIRDVVAEKNVGIILSFRSWVLVAA